METAVDHFQAPTSIRTDLGAIFVSMELSRDQLVTHIPITGGRGENVEACGAQR